MITWVVVCPSSNGNKNLEARIVFLKVGKVAEKLRGQTIHPNNVILVRGDECKGEVQVCQRVDGYVFQGLCGLNTSMSVKNLDG